MTKAVWMWPDDLLMIRRHLPVPGGWLPVGGVGGRGARPSGWRGCAPRLMALALALASGLAWAWVVAPVRRGGIGVWHEQWRTPRQWRGWVAWRWRAALACGLIGVGRWRGRTAWRWRAALVLALERRGQVAWADGLAGSVVGLGVRSRLRWWCGCGGRARERGARRQKVPWQYCCVLHWAPSELTS